MNIPEERLKIFISSAQRKEDDLEWLDFRKQIKKALSKCKYLNPFIIEDRVSEINSIQFMTYNVMNSDITVVLIKNDFRYGTSVEIETAIKCNKPLLLYFFGDENENEEVKMLRKVIEGNDYCTYKHLAYTETADKIILNDVITNVITYYQFKHFNIPLAKEEPVALSDISAGNEKITLSVEHNEMPEVTICDDKYSIPTKSTIMYFKSSYDAIFEYLQSSTMRHYIDKKEQPSKLHTIGKSILKWLILGENFINKKVIEELTDSAAEMYSNIEWFSKRLEAINFIIIGDYDQAIVLENQALDIAKAENQPQWIINDILIDLRNLDIKSNDGFGLGGEAQSELNKSATNVFLPVSDRYLQDVYEEIIEQEITLSTAPSGTIFFGSNYVHVINKIENYLFAAIMYGSYTHMYIARLTLARILFKYAKLYCDRELMFGSVKMFLLSGKTKEFRNIINQNWSDIYLELTSKSDELWLLTEKVEKLYKDNIKIVVFQMTGPYLCDSMFNNASEYIYSLSSAILIGNSEDYFKCINNNIDRLNNERIIESLCNILEHKRFTSCNMLSQIIFRLDFEDVSEQQQIIFCNLLSENLKYIFEHNGDPQIIVALIQKNPSVFNSLEEKSNKWITGINKKYFEINSGRGSWLETLQELIEMARLQFEKNRNPGHYTSFANDPFASIITIIDEYFSEEMKPVVLEKFIPFCNDVLISFAPVAEKQKCVDCLCHLVGYYKKHNYSIPDSLLDSIECFNYPKREMYMSFSSSSKETLGCELLILRVLVGKSDTKDLFQWVIQYSKKEENERIAISESITTYLKYMVGITNIDSIIPIVFLCCEDKNTIIKINGCYCLAYLLDSDYYEMACSKLYDMVLDPVPKIRDTIISMCEDNYIVDAEVKAKLLFMLVDDADFRIRNRAIMVQINSK